MSENKYPCAECGKLRTKDEGGTTFTVCDECWSKLHSKSVRPTGEGLLTDKLRDEVAKQLYADDGFIADWYWESSIFRPTYLKQADKVIALTAEQMIEEFRNYYRGKQSG